MIQIQIHLKSFHASSLIGATQCIQEMAEFLFAAAASQVQLPSHIRKITVLRSPHIDKKSREQFQLKTFKKVVTVVFQTSRSASIFLQLMKNAEFSGVESTLNLFFLEYPSYLFK